MSPPYAALRRQPVQPQFAQNLQTLVFPAPTRGIIQSENEAYMLAGGAIVQDNWVSTMRGVKLRGGCIRWCDIHSLDEPAWIPAHAYAVNDWGYDAVDGSFWFVAVAHTSAATGTFAADRAAHPTYWTNGSSSIPRKPIISSFEYITGAAQKMFAAQATKLFDVTTSTPVLVRSGQNSGNWSAAQYSNASGSWLIAVNDAGDFPLRFNGSTWQTLDPALGAGPLPDGANNILGPGGAAPPRLSYVWKYRNRLFFLEAGKMNAYYLGIDAVGGNLALIPLSGACTKGGKLLWGSTWSLDSGDGLDEKCLFASDQGEVLIFTGTNPGDPNNWAQQGRYNISAPLGMNGHLQVGGDTLILTVDGIVPLSQAITKDAGQLELAMLTRTIKLLWRQTVAARRVYPWTIKKWDEQGDLFVATPGGPAGNKSCLVTNNVTGAWGRFIGWDAMTFMRLGQDMYFGTQDGVVMQANRSGYDDGVPYVATLIGGWEMFGAPASEVVWHQARASFRSASGEPFQPQLTATVDYVVTVPHPPPPGPDPGTLSAWDQGLWGPAVPPHVAAKWDQPIASPPPVRNTLWVSIGMTGFAHAPIVQVTVAQQAAPDVELIAVAATFERAGVNV